VNGVRRTSPILSDYMAHLRRRGLTPASRSSYVIILKGYVASHNPATVTTAAIEGWLDDRNLVARSRYTYIGAIAGFHKWAFDNGHAPSDPSLGVVRPKLPRRYPRPARTADLVDAIEHAPLRMRAWLCLAAYSGLRCKEIAGLRVDDIFLDQAPPVFHLRETKGDKDRVVPIADDVVRALEAYGPPVAGFVFPAMDPSGQRTKRSIRAHYVSDEINKYLHGRGISATAHQLRHWFGTELYRRTLDLKLVGEMMGHAKVETTSLYVALVPTEQAIEAVRTMRAVLPPDDDSEPVSLEATA